MFTDWEFMMSSSMAQKTTKLLISDMKDDLIKVFLKLDPMKIIFSFKNHFLGIEYTGDSASYFLAGIYLEDNLGQLFSRRNKQSFFYT